MDELVHHCLRELSFDGDLGEFLNGLLPLDSASVVGCQDLIIATERGSNPVPAHYL